MENLAYQGLVMIGLCFIIKYGKILDFVRIPLKKIKFFHDLLSCALCLGFQLGFWKTLVSGITLTNFSSWPGLFSSAICFALFSSAVCWISDNLIQVMQVYVYGRD